MHICSWFILILFVSSSVVHISVCYNILVVAPFQARSHFAFVEPVTMELAKRGHRVTVYTPFPASAKLENYRTIDTSTCFRQDTLISTMMSIEKMRYTTILKFAAFDIFVPTLDQVKECEPLMKLLKSSTEPSAIDSDKYDLLITETFVFDFTLIFGRVLQLPVIAYIPNTLLPWLGDRIGNPMNPSYMPYMLTDYTSQMSFLQRVHNTLEYTTSLMYYNQVTTSYEEKTVQYLLDQLITPGNAACPSTRKTKLRDLIKNTTVIFSNSHPSLGVPSQVPLVPGVIQISGVHIKNVSAIPKEVFNPKFPPAHSLDYQIIMAR